MIPLFWTMMFARFCVRPSDTSSSTGTLRLQNGLEINSHGMRRVSAPAIAAASATVTAANVVDCAYTAHDDSAGGSMREWTSAVDDFILLRVLGKGASATVQLALHIPSLTIVALKMVHDVYDASKRHQLVRELNALVDVASISNCVNFYGAYFNDGAVVLSLEYMNRGSLQDLVDRHGPLPLPFIVSAARQMLHALHSLHACQRMHRDLKPANVLLNHAGCEPVCFLFFSRLSNSQIIPIAIPSTSAASAVKLADFGIIGRTDQDALMHTFCGTQARCGVLGSSSHTHTHTQTLYVSLCLTCPLH